MRRPSSTDANIEIPKNVRFFRLSVHNESPATIEMSALYSDDFQEPKRVSNIKYFLKIMALIAPLALLVLYITMELAYKLAMWWPL